MVSVWGCASTGYRQAVETWTLGARGRGGNLRVYLRYLLEDGDLQDVSRQVRLQAAAGLPCVIDEDRGTSTGLAPSAACACAKDSQTCETWARGMVGSPPPAASGDTPAPVVPASDKGEAARCRDVSGPGAADVCGGS